MSMQCGPLAVSREKENKTGMLTIQNDVVQFRSRPGDPVCVCASVRGYSRTLLDRPHHRVYAGAPLRGSDSHLVLLHFPVG